MLEMTRRAPPAIATVIAALLLVLCLFAILPVDRELRHRFEGLARRLELSLEDQSGFGISYDTLSPSILGGLTVSQLRITDRGGAIVLSARKVVFNYDLAAFLSGDGASVITEVSIEGGEGRVDAATWNRIQTLLLPGGQSASSKAVLLPHFKLRARDLHLELPDILPGGVMVNLKRARLDSTLPEPAAEIDSDIALKLEGVGAIDASITLRGSLSSALDAARVRLSISGRSDAFSLARQEFDLVYSGGVIDFRKVRDSAPVDIHGSYAIAGGSRDGGSSAVSSPGEILLSLRSDSFRPESLFTVRKGLSFLEDWLAEAWSGSAIVRLPLANPSALHFQIDLSGALPVSAIEGGYAVHVAASGDMANIVVSESSAIGPLGRFSFSGALQPADFAIKGKLAVQGVFLESRLPVDISLEAAGGKGRYFVTSPAFSAGGVAFGGLSVEATLHGKELEFSISLALPESVSKAPAVSSARPLLVAEGSYASGATPLLECSINWDKSEAISFSPMLRAFFEKDLAATLSTLTLAGGLVVRTDFSHFSWSATDLALTSTLLPDLTALVSASGADRSVTIRRANLGWKGYSAGLSGTVQISEAGGLGFDASVLFSGIPYSVKGSFIGGNLNLEGDYGLRFSGRLYGGTGLASLTLSSFPLPLPGLPLIVSLESDLRFASAQDWTLALASISVQASPSENAVLTIPRISFSGIFGPEGGDIAKLEISDPLSKVSGAGRLTWNRNASSPTAKIDVSSPSGESYKLEAGYANERLEAALSIRSSPLARFIRSDLKGLVDGDLLFSGPLNALEVIYRTDLRQGRLGDSPMILALSGSLTRGNAILTDGHLLWRGYDLSRLKGRLSLEDGAGELGGRFETRETLAGASFNFSAKAVSRFSGSGGLGPHLADYRVEGTLADISYNQIKTPTWPFVIDLSPKGLMVSGGVGAEVRVSVLGDGSFTARAVEPFPFHFDVRGRTRGDQIDVEASGLSLDLPLLLSIIPPIPVKFQSGTLSGDLVIKGPSADPEFSGALRVADCKLSLPGWIIETAGPVSAPVVVDGKRLFLQAPTVPIKSSNFALTLEMVLDGWIPAEIRIGVRSLAGTSIPMETRLLGILVKGNAVPNLDLDIVGPVLAVKGSLLIQKTDIVVGTEVLAPYVEPTSAPDSLLDISLAIRFGKGVRVFFPTKDNPVIAGDADPSSRLDIRYDQARDEMSVKGDANLRGGDAFYIQRNFFLKSARLRFNENSQKFDPLVTLLAELRDSDAGKPITVTLRADNMPISTFKPRLISDPPKSESDIALLLGQGLFATDAQGQLNLASIAISGSEFVPRLNLVKSFETLVRESLNLDVFYLRSLVLQRWLVDLSRPLFGTSLPSSLGTSQSSLGAGQSSIADYFKETSLYAGKYLSDTVFFHGLARLKNDPLAPFLTLGLDSEIGVDFETPFGLLQWSVQPSHPEQLFINDQSLSLSWRLAL